MSAALSLRVFAVYLFTIALLLMTVPALLLEPFGLPAPKEPWVRVVGMLAGLIGYYYWRAVSAGVTQIYLWSVHARLSVLVFFAVFVALHWAPPPLLIFGVIDALAAIWTWLAWRRDRARSAAN